ncbi:hypothetical protein Daus18300_011003 [Diaporthe australafricana]|uniref:CorA-like transporter domain-containing protein n=1 Tax=Diaporthe australafricana TaxID=127596 RepID=A0ABR3W873_9PEZI
MAINMYDQLVEACREAETWPLNLLRKQQLNRVLINYQQRLHADESRLLGTRQASVEFWEAPIGAEYLVGIPEIGRSGWELRHCYKLHGLEPSSSTSKAKWAMRQTAIYHSFDLENGRALWLTVKANNEISDRIKEGTESLEAMRASSSSGPGPSFVACLTTHLIAFDWCTEGWRWNLGDIEKDVQEILLKVKSTPIEPLGDELNFTPRLIATATMPSPRDREGSMISRQGTLHIRNDSIPSSNVTNSLSARISAAMSGMASKAGVEKSQETSSSMEAQIGREQQDKISNHLEKLKSFSFSEFQKLNFFTTKLQEAKLAMRLNIGVLKSTREYYQQRYQSAQFPATIKDFCESNGSYEHFVRRVTSLELDLEADTSRIEALIMLIEDGKRLSYNMEINRLFTLSGHGISERMEYSAMRMEQVTDSMHKIAHATARDSASMSVITFVTLIVLPGTFLGTFFSTPIVNTPEDQDNPQSWSINRGVFLLFIEICVPMTAIVMLIWGLYMIRETGT